MGVELGLSLVMRHLVSGTARIIAFMDRNGLGFARLISLVVYPIAELDSRATDLEHLVLPLVIQHAQTL